MDSFLTAAAVRSKDALIVPTPPTGLPDGFLVEEKYGRGRSLVLTRAAVAGEVLLAEAPVCWWVDADRHGTVCARCLAVVPFGGYKGCSTCRQAVWCSEECFAEDAQRHRGVCHLLRGKTNGQGGGEAAPHPIDGVCDSAVNLLHFAAHALALHASAPTMFARLMALNTAGVETDEDE